MNRELAPVGISYSGGSSSEWLVEATWRGVIPTPARYAVFFADTGAEHSWTYEAVNQVEARCASRGVTFIRCRRPGVNLVDHILAAVTNRASRMDHPPFWVAKAGAGSKGILEQRCTREWKGRTLSRAHTAWLKSIGIRKNRRLCTWIGFGADELSRVMRANSKKPEHRWSWMDFPAVRLGVSREQQRADLIEWTGRAPRFSMCTCCPYKSPQRWRETTGPDLVQALAVDAAIRDLSFMDLTDGECFLSDRLVDVATAAAMPGSDGPEEPCASGLCFL